MIHHPLFIISVVVGTIVAAIRNLWRFDEHHGIGFDEAVARTLIWPIVVAVFIARGLLRTVKGGFK